MVAPELLTWGGSVEAHFWHAYRTLGRSAYAIHCYSQHASAYCSWTVEWHGLSMEEEGPTDLPTSSCQGQLFSELIDANYCCLFFPSLETLTLTLIIEWLRLLLSYRVHHMLKPVFDPSFAIVDHQSNNSRCLSQEIDVAEKLAVHRAAWKCRWVVMNGTDVSTNNWCD